MNKKYFEHRGSQTSGFDFWRYGNDLGRKLDNIEIDSILSKINTNKREVSILDLGCGTGYHLDTIVRKISVGSSVGIDFSETYIETAKSECSSDINFYSSNVDNFSKFLKNDKFDFILMIGLLQYLDSREVEDLVSSLENILDSKGSLIIKHPVYFGEKSCSITSMRDGHKYTSFYKTFDDLMTPFNRSFRVESMNRIFYKKDFTEEEYDQLNSVKNTEQMLITLDRK